MQNQLRALYESEGYRVESMNTDGDRAQVTLLWDQRCRPRCAECGQAMRINRKTRQSALDLPLGPANFVGVLYEAVQGFCRHCGRYETVRPLGIVEAHMATLRLMRHVSLLCRWLPVQRVCEVVAVTPASAYRCDRSILQTELPEPHLDGLEALRDRRKTPGPRRLRHPCAQRAHRRTALAGGRAEAAAPGTSGGRSVGEPRQGCPQRLLRQAERGAVSAGSRP